MPFREEDKNIANARRVAQQWLHAFFLEDWLLKLLALAIAFGLWYGVTSQRSPATSRMRGVQLDFLLAEGLEISNEPRDEIEVTLRGDRQALEQVAARNLVARVDITGLKAGERVARITPQSVAMELPDGVQIEKLEPNTVPVRLERSVERVLDVEARFEGNVPDGYELRNVQITPSAVRVRGPQSHVEAIQKAHTESIPLEGQTGNFTVPQTAIDILDTKVTPLDSVVAVRVEVGEQRIERRFAGVAVRAVGDDVQSVLPARVAVVLRGSRSALEALKAEELEIVVEETADKSVRPRLLLPSGLEGRAELVSTEPDAFTVTRKGT